MLNPITYAEKVVGDFLRYQLTTYPLSDERLYAQMRELLSLEKTRATPLLRGPYVSLSRSFRTGASIAELTDQKVLHPHMRALASYPNVYGHQEKAIRSIVGGQTTLVSTGTGSGKTECFLYPIISRCLQLRDENAPPGIVAVLVYPMNALAEDQLGRLRAILCGSGIPFGMYVGKTPETTAEVTGVRLEAGASQADYEATLKRLREQKQNAAVYPPEERASREEMRQAGGQPRILLTNVKQLELLLTRQRDVELFQGSRLDFLVFDEAHTFSGATGAETACLIRRLRSFCGRGPRDTVCIATSATIADRERGKEAGREFASRFFGVQGEDVALVHEEYVDDLWAAEPKATGPLPGDPAVQLRTVLEAVEGVEEEPPSKDALQVLKTAFQAITGSALDTKRWQESLYERLAANKVVYEIAQALTLPRHLADLVRELGKKLGRKVPEEEVVVWLALGAASRKEGRPLLRPVMHGFVRGVGGAVVTFPADDEGPRLWLSREDATLGGGAEPDGAPALQRLDVLTCTTCGQHYFAHHVADFTFIEKAPGGGEAVENRRVWKPLEEKAGGCRVVLYDRLVSDDDDDDDGPGNVAPLFLCRHCGALHPAHRDRCDGCGMERSLVELFAVAQKEDEPGKLTRCVACGAHGQRRLGVYREPARPVRAQNVSDVHVLAQSMLQHAERPRLLVFTDSRQDAAFQAGWMQDHARRFRLRSLMNERIERAPVSVGDLTGYLDDLLDRDDDLSRALLPEVWRAERKESAGTRHAHERRRFLRFQVLREIVTGMRQSLGLEPWGRLLVEYEGLTAELGFIREWSGRLGCQPSDLRDGVATVLDVLRRGGILYDREGRLYTRFWHDSDFEVQRGYFPPIPGGPKGVKLQRASSDDPSRVKQLLSPKGTTAVRQAAVRWGVESDEIDEFLGGLWSLVTEGIPVIVPVVLTGRRDRALPGCMGARQIDADRLTLHSHRGFYRCSTCRRMNLRATPRMACPGHHCKGTLVRTEENPDNFDLMVLDQRFTMVRPREHSAQVPTDERELLERAFKGDSELVNTLVCTPTLELGVDIGALDSVLMRNVPPLPANYWQRAGRAGRRHRMAVDLTYARSVSHDRAYFADPLKMLHGPINPPRFNLRNEPMVRKHAHATVLTKLHSMLAREGLMAVEDREALAKALEHSFPRQIRTYLFDADDNVRTLPYDVIPLHGVLSKHEGVVVQAIANAFSQGWPEHDAGVVSADAVRRYVSEMGDQLAEVIRTLESRLRWALDQMRRLDEVRAKKGTLDAEDQALYDRCDRLVRRLKGKAQRRKRDAEGFDDTNTYAVLAAEGFLPGYGLDTGTVVGYYEASRYGVGARDWELRRPVAMALREYVPGNLIYANGHRFLPRLYHLEAVEPTTFQVDAATGAVTEVGTGNVPTTAGLATSMVPAVPICDVVLPHQSHITDDEDYRFQLAVSVFGYEQKRHGGGRAFSWGRDNVTHRTAVHLRLVNVGPGVHVRNGGTLGYPVCLVCGQSRSPLATQADRDAFSDDHRDRCGRPVGSVGFFADAIADALTLQDCTSLTEAYSVAEALRFGAAEVLEMELTDLQLLVIGRPGEERCDVLIYDPMPGGSGLLDQMVERWGEVVAEALQVVENCPAACETACIDCLLHYRNAFYHPHLNRRQAAERLHELGDSLRLTHEIPPLLPTYVGTEKPVNEPESILRQMLERAGFVGAVPQHPIDLGKPLGTTTPDFFFGDPTGRLEGICIYLDGMGKGAHGNPATARRDREIREELRGRAYEVIEIQYGQLFDRDAMARHFYKLGRLLLGKDRAEALRGDASWFVADRGDSRA